MAKENNSQKIILWIFGAQRSGTTATLKGLGQMTDSVLDFTELNDIIHDPGRMEGIDAIRLKPQEELEAIFAKQREKVLVAKPLMESQRAAEILAEYPDSAGLWLLRNYRAVANSMMHKGWEDAGFLQLRHLANRRGSWRDENASDMVVSTVRELLEIDLTRADACALAWWARNTLFFDQNLANHERLAVIQYEKLVSDADHLPEKLRQIGLDCQLAADFYHQASVEKGRALEICDPVAKLCDELTERLTQAESRKRPEPKIRFTLTKPTETAAPNVSGWRALPGFRQIYRERARLSALQTKYDEVRTQRASYQRRYEALRQRFEALHSSDPADS